MILISACLAGCLCRYDGGTNLVPELRQLVEDGKAIAVCPEELGGLSTPREPSECRGDNVFTKSGKDVTEAFQNGAEQTLRIAVQAGCRKAILKARRGCSRIAPKEQEAETTQKGGLGFLFVVK